MAGGFIHHVQHLVRLADVTHDGVNGSARFLHLLASTLQLGFIACRQNEPAAVARKLFRQCQAKPARSAGNEYGLAMNVITAQVTKLVENSPAGQQRSHASGGACHQGSSYNSAQNG